MKWVHRFFSSTPCVDGRNYQFQSTNWIFVNQTKYLLKLHFSYWFCTKRNWCQLIAINCKSIIAILNSVWFDKIRNWFVCVCGVNILAEYFRSNVSNSRSFCSQFNIILFSYLISYCSALWHFVLQFDIVLFSNFT